ncbi:MAG: hypothetical protein IKP58_07220 [Victivallales bacterium]|nr:hypothetical protein [Victivallales bacterium]
MAEEETKNEKPQAEEAAVEKHEAEPSEEHKAESANLQADKPNEKEASGWRYAGIWLAICVGTALALLFLGDGKRLLTPVMPIALTLGGISCIGMSSICVWGLLFTIPMYCVCSHWLKGGVWWRLLPVIAFLQGMLASLNLAFMGDGADSSLLKSGAKELTEAEMSRLAEVASARWATGGLAAVACLCLLVIHICICGPKKSWNAIRDQWNLMRKWLKEMREKSKAEEEETKLQAKS